MKPNAIVVCCTANYIPYSLVTLLSCREHGGDDPADFHLIVADGTVVDQERVEDFAKANGFTVHFHGVVVNALAHKIDHNGFGIGSLARLFLNEWISPNYKRVLYLDSDLLAVGPVVDIFNVDMQGKPIAAVEDWVSLELMDGKRPEQVLFEGLGLKPDARYFSAGVLLMNWPQVLAGKRLQKAVARGVKFKESGVFQRYADQDILNAEFKEDWLPLPVRFNAINLYALHFPRRLVFRHFAGPYKPWHEMLNPYSLSYGGVYRSALRRTPWVVPRFPRWRKLTEWSFKEHYRSWFVPGFRKKIARQLQTD